MLLSGIVPPLADSYYVRTESGPDLAATLRPGETVVLAPAEAGETGTGKTQLAVEFTHTLWNARTAEVLVWVTASSREAILTSFAQAASAVDGVNPAETAQAAAARFVSWLAQTRRPWVLIIDDLRDTADLADLWPAGQAGRVVITTSLSAAALGGTALGGTALGGTGLGGSALGGGAAVRVVPLGGFSRREALSYLSSRLTEYPDQRVEALDLGEDLGELPLALAQATAVMNARKLGCRQYRVMYADRRKHMEDIDGASAEVLTTWSLASECAHELAPAGLAWPALALAAMMDRNGIPGAVLTSPAACAYVGGPPESVRAAISNLARAGLVSIDPASAVRTIRMHGSVQAAVRTWLPRADQEQAAATAADALVETWPEGSSSSADPELEQALRDCVPDAGLLWQPEPHPVLFRAGLSREDSRLGEAAIAYWQAMVATSTRVLGATHGSTAAARDRLAAAYESAGRSGEAIAVFQAALADRERGLGPEHPDTLAAREHLAKAYQSAGRPGDAVALYEHAVTEAEQLLGLGHPSTFAARASLAAAYQAAGMGKEAISAGFQLVGDCDRLLGAGHPTTLSSRAGLGLSLQTAGQHKEAIDCFERSLGDHERMHGRDHTDTIAARAALASAYRAAGKGKDAVGQYERVLADRERIQGPDNPETIAARANLAYAYRSAGRLRDAIPAYERTLADRERVQGRDHRETLVARTNLAAAYQQARRLTDAIPQYERALADSDRILGPGDIETLTTRCNLASAFYTAGRLQDAVTLLRRALSDCERHLGPDHTMTSTVRANLDAATQV
jgi:tetratricopeptide (TPR) repeat protein